MAWQGLSNAAIARRLRVTTTSVRLWLNNTDKELCRKGRFTDD
jgi:transposase